MQSTPKLKIACWNSRGFSGAIPYLRQLVKENDIVAISEHWLHGNRLNQLYEIASDVNICARASKAASAENYGVKRGQGGVALVWKKHLGGASEITNVIHDRICGIRLQSDSGGVVNIFSVYLPAMGCGDDYAACIDDLAEILESREQGSTSVVCGDCNGDIGNLYGSRGWYGPNVHGRVLFKFMQEFGLIACNFRDAATGPLQTHVGNASQATLDYVLVAGELEQCISSCHTATDNILNTSDHRAIYVTLNVGGFKGINVGVNCKGIPRWDKLSVDQITNMYTNPLQAKLSDVILTLSENDIDGDGIDKVISTINSILIKAARVVPKSKFKAHLRPYWNKELSELKFIKVQKYKTWVDAGRPRDQSNPVWRDYKASKKMFVKTLRRLSKQYDNEQVVQAVEASNIDRGLFWRLVKKSRKGISNKTTAIRNEQDKVVNSVPEALEVWRTHFEKLGTPRYSDDFDATHHAMVSRRVKELNNEVNVGNLLETPLADSEVSKALEKLHKRKACGFDNISAEHLIYAGKNMVKALTMLYNHIIKIEYVPTNFRRGIQIPLFKGKGACCLDVNSYRGISLLTNYNKVYEIVLWNRMSKWWEESRVISDLQGAGKKGQSCVHTALILQEAIAASREKGHKVFVAFYDVSKAYDTVWTDGLFFQLHEMGVRGKLWRLMYRAYVDFKCRVRLGNEFSDWYGLNCGIHQGGFLSLTKYVAFINSLITSLEESKLCCQIHRVPASPAGYADDLAAACTSKHKIDKVMDKVNSFGCKWRFQFNAKKSAILVYGEESWERKIGSKNRFYKLGKDKVQEKLEYDHVGIKACVLDDNSRIEEKLAKGRRALNATAGLGIRKSGLVVATCNLIFWTIVIPIITFGCELWSMCENDILKLQAFQRYAGRRVQRFPQRSPSCSSFFGLGWIRLETLILTKKVIFIHTLVRMVNNNRLCTLFKARVLDYLTDRKVGESNIYGSPIFGMLNASKRLGLLDIVLNAIGGSVTYSKSMWSK